LDLGTPQEFTPSQFAPVSVRWILTHLIDETARHLGHLDVLRDVGPDIVGVPSRLSDRRWLDRAIFGAGG
jgi:hypothetical protein